MIPCVIVGINEQLDFETNTARSILVLRLADGTHISAEVNDEARAAIVTQHVQANGAPVAGPPTLPTPPARAAVPMRDPVIQYMPEAPEEPDLIEFGAEPQGYAPAENAPPSEQVYTSGPRIEVPPEYERPPQNPHARPPKRGEHRGNFIADAPRRRVPMDEFGYPIVPNTGGVDPDTLTSSQNQDEDGIASL